MIASQLFTGLVLGMILVLLTLGLWRIFGLTSVIVEIVKLIWGRWGLPFHPSSSLRCPGKLVQPGPSPLFKRSHRVGVTGAPEGLLAEGGCWSAPHPPTADPRYGTCPVSCCGPVYGAGGVEYPSPPSRVGSGRNETARQRVLDEAPMDAYNGVLHVRRLHCEVFASAARAAHVM
jgi:hypothetical protein